MIRSKNCVTLTLFKRRHSRGKLKLGLAIAASALALEGCQKTAETPQIMPSTGEFSAEAEALYLERHFASLEAFKTGKDTADYDTEIAFGSELEPSPIARGSSSLPDEALSKLINYAEQNNSASFILYENGKITSEHYFGDHKASTLLNSKSLAKPLGVIAVGRAIKAGHIKGLDQLASDYILEWKGKPQEAITVRHLLSMTSGLLAQGYPKGPEDVMSRAYLHPHHDEVIIHEYPIVNEPGTRYEYANANSEIVATIISRATGMSYQDWLVKEVLSPLGAAGGKIWINREGGTAHSGCCAKLNSETYLRLAIMVLNKGQWDGEVFLPESFVAEMTTATAQNKFAGMGVYNGKYFKEFRGAINPDQAQDYTAAKHSEPYVDKDILLFDGNANQVIFILPRRNAVIARLGQIPPGDKKWDNTILPNSYVRALGE